MKTSLSILLVAVLYLSTLNSTQAHAWKPFPEPPVIIKPPLQKSSKVIALKLPSRNIVRQPIIPTNEVQRLIVKWARHYGVNEQRVLRIAACESGYRANATNGQYKGVFQQGQTWWAARSARYGRAGASIFNADANIQVSIAMMAQGGFGHWECK